MRQKHDINTILQVGIFLLRRQGYHHTGINDVLKETGIPKGSFYNYFGSKKDFAVLCLRRYSGQLLRLMERELLSPDLPAIDRIANYYNLTIEAHAQEECRYGCLLMNLSVETGGTEDAIAREADIQFQQWMDVLAVCIREGQKQQNITHPAPAELLAEQLHLAFYGALVRARMLRTSKPLQQALERELRQLVL